MMTVTKFEIGSRVERVMGKFVKQYGTVIEVGEDSNSGRVRIKWIEYKKIPCQWNGVIGSGNIKMISTGDPEVTISMDGSPRTWVSIKSLKLV